MVLVGRPEGKNHLEDPGGDGSVIQGPAEIPDDLAKQL